MNGNTIVELHGVSRSYVMGDSQVHALKACDLQIHEGEFIALFGRSGSGKSTLCNILGLLDQPNTGDVFLRRKPVNGLNDTRLSMLRNQHIGFVFQQFNLIPVLTALENVMLPSELGLNDRQAARRHCIQLLERLGLGSHMHHRPQHLSGGQQQRVAIARALVNSPSLIIADEPTANLDSKTARDITGYMRELQIDQGVTFVFATHDTELIELASRRIELSDGVVQHDGVATA